MRKFTIAIATKLYHIFIKKFKIWLFDFLADFFVACARNSWRGAKIFNVAGGFWRGFEPRI